MAHVTGANPVRRGSITLSLTCAALGAISCRSDEPLEPSAPAFATAVNRVVNSAADPGDGSCTASNCTLREAVNAAGTTSISFGPGLAGPITLAKPTSGGGELLIGKSLSITGPSAGIVVQRRSTDPAFRILRIGAGFTVSLTNLTVRNGKVGGSGGGILNDGTLSLMNSTVSGGSASQGGGIYNHGPLTLTNSTVSGNSATASFRPSGGIDNHGRLTIVHSTIANNSGCGIINRNNFILELTTTTVGQNSDCGIGNVGGTLRLTSSTISGNAGVGITTNRGTTTLTQVRVVSNSTGGIALVNGRLNVRRSTVTGNSSAYDGAGLANYAGNATISSSTFMSNRTTGLGGGIFNSVGDPFGRQSSTLTLGNSTVSENSARLGGGIYNWDDLGGANLTVTNSTVASNNAQEEAGGIGQEDALERPNSVSLRNSVVANNTAPTAPDVRGSLSASFTLIGNGTGADIANTNGNKVGKVSPNASVIDPNLGALVLNGGPTRTHALLAGSPAIDAAAADDCYPDDQRGVARPQGAGCDMGSYEKQ